MKIAVFRALQLGDLLCAVPALRALDAAYPKAHITLIGLPWARQFADRFRRYLDDFMMFPGFPGLREREPDIGEIPRFFDNIGARRFDLAIQLHGSGELTNSLTVLMGAAQTAGFYRPGHYCPDPERFVEWRDGEHEVLRWLRLVQALGASPQGTELEFPLREPDWAEWRAMQLGDYACLHVGSQLPSRRWPPERFAKVGDALAAEGLRIVLTGTEHEATLTRKVKDTMRERAVDLAGRTTLGGLAAVIAGARVLVCNDTGVSHIAAATKTPSVVIASGSDPKRWAPLDTRLHHVLHHAVPCRPCVHASCPVGHPCALGVEVSEVIRETTRLACAA